MVIRLRFRLVEPITFTLSTLQNDQSTAHSYQIGKFGRTERIAPLFACHQASVFVASDERQEVFSQEGF
jgi:hypothetical protein